MTDYWLSKLFYDLHNDPKLAAEYRADMLAVLDRYELTPEMRKAVLADDVGRARAARQCLSAALLFPGPRHAAGGIHGAAQCDGCARKQPRRRLRPWLASSEYSRRATARSSRATGRPCRRVIAPSSPPAFDELGATLPGVPAGSAGGDLARSLGEFLPQQSAGGLHRHRRRARRTARAVHAEGLSGRAAQGPRRRSAGICSTPRSTADFEPALSHRLKLDHGTCIPLWRMGVDLDAADRADHRQRSRRADAEHPSLPGLGPGAAAGDRKLSRAAARRHSGHRRA